jgi:RNA exonuclease 4
MSPKTLKKRRGILRKTSKKYVRSGGVRALNPQAQHFVMPSSLKPVSPKHASPKPASPKHASLKDENTSGQYFTAIATLSAIGNPKAKKEIEGAVAVDCEMVGIGPIKTDKDGREYRESSLAHVVIVDFNGREIYNKLVIPKEGIDKITDYRTFVSGVEEDDLKGLNPETHSYNKVISEVRKKLKGRVIVGHGLKNDFKVLDYKPAQNKVWDTAVIDTYMQDGSYIPHLGRLQREARKLKHLAKEFANNNIQIPGHTHNPTEDTRASMNLYRIFCGYPKLPLH